MYSIEIKKAKRTESIVLSFATRESAMQSWDDFVDLAQPGDHLTLRHPKGSILSDYKVFKGAS